MIFNHRLRSTITLLCLSITVFSSCKKDGSSSTGTTSRLALLTSGTWTFQSYNEKNSAGQWVNDDPSSVTFYVTFNANGTCTETGSSTIGQWQANADFTTLTITNSDAHGSFDIETLTSSSLQLLNTGDGELWIYSK